MERMKAYLQTLKRARELAEFEGMGLVHFVFGCVCFYLNWWYGVTEVQDETAL